MPQSRRVSAGVGLLLVAIASLTTCSGGRAAVIAAGAEAPGASPLPARPLGEQSPKLLAAWRRTDAEWADWTDPSAKYVRFIAVPGHTEGDVRLEVLDWGGHGPALVLLAGLGESGHIYNDLAPRLTDRFRVIALTRRGHGASSPADTSTYVLDTLAADIGAVMDSLHLKRASLIGHSIAGSEITRFAARYPDRVDKLVYLDASHDFAGVDSVLGANPAWPPDFSPPPGTARDTLNAARDWSKRYRFGYWSDALESGVNRSPDPDPAATRCLLRDAILHPKEYRAVQASALALTARSTMHHWFFYLDPVVDGVKWSQAEHWLTMVVQPWLEIGHERFRREMQTGRTVEFETDHHLFNSHPERTLREIRGFLLSPAAPGTVRLNSRAKTRCVEKYSCRSRSHSARRGLGLQPSPRMQPTGRMGAEFHSAGAFCERGKERRFVRARAGAPATDVQIARKTYLDSRSCRK